MLSDERYKELMDSFGFPNSSQLLFILQQAVLEATLIERERCAVIAEDEDLNYIAKEIRSVL